jgi:hypothetical protein
MGPECLCKQPQPSGWGATQPSLHARTHFWECESNEDEDGELNINSGASSQMMLMLLLHKIKVQD